LGPILPDGFGDCLRRYGWEVVDHPPYPSNLRLPYLRLANDGVQAVLHHTENYSLLTVLMFWPENSDSTALATDRLLAHFFSAQLVMSVIVNLSMFT
jgi:hypothetical protein